MTNEFFKVEVNFFDHAKIVDLSDIQLRLHLTAIAYANRLMTDGFIATSIAKRLIDPDPFSQGWDWQDHAKALVMAKLWHEVEGGYRIHDFLEHNTPREERLRKRAEDRDRKARYREAKRTEAERPQGVHKEHGDVSQRDSASPSDGTPMGQDEVSLASARATTEAEAETQATTEGLNTVASPSARPVSIERQVLDFWKAERGKNGNTRFTTARRNVVATALRAGYTTDDMFDAIRGVTLDPWPDRPQHDDLIIILRLGGRGNRNNLEHFRDLWRDGPQPARAASSAQRQIDQARRTYEEMMADAAHGMGTDHRPHQRELARPAGRQTNG